MRVIKRQVVINMEHDDSGAAFKGEDDFTGDEHHELGFNHHNYNQTSESLRNNISLKDETSEVLP